MIEVELLLQKYKIRSMTGKGKIKYRYLGFGSHPLMMAIRTTNYLDKISIDSRSFELRIRNG